MIFVTGDVHNYRDYLRIKNNNKLKQLSKKDYLIICGDLGINLGDDYFLEELSKSNYTILFIDGNHENFSFLNSFPVTEWNNGKIHKLSDNVFHLMRGQVFIIEGKTFFTFGGAQSIFRKDLKEKENWWPELEEGNEKEQEEGYKNLLLFNNQVDYIITHTCSSTYLPILSSMLTIFLEETKTNLYLENIENKIKYKRWFFGHFHEDIELDKKATLLFYNITKII